MDRPSYDLFIAAPMNALDEEAYDAGRDFVLELKKSLSTSYGLGRIYFAGTEATGRQAFTQEAAALRRDLEALRSSRLVVLIYPGKVVTSALVEIGYALALGLPCLLLVRDRDDLPYLLRRADQEAGGDLFPPIRTEILGGPDRAARQIALFRDALAK